MTDAEAERPLEGGDRAENPPQREAGAGEAKAGEEATGEISPRGITFLDVIIELGRIEDDIRNYKSVVYLGSERERRTMILQKAALIVSQAHAAHVAAVRSKGRRRS